MQTFRCAGVSTTGERVRCYRRVRAEGEPAYCSQHTPGGKERALKIAALREKVVEAAMVYWRAKLDLTYSCADLRKMEDAEDAACKALDAAMRGE